MLQAVLLVIQLVERVIILQILAKVALMGADALFMPQAPAQALFVPDATTTLMSVVRVHLPDQAITVPTIVFQKMTQNAV
ncbi:MAG: hypothetical protein M1450_01290, partial [Patescibacteria group bacterium]|nr:hypothetical protein [Patescibacteria group bacterium]